MSKINQRKSKENLVWLDCEMTGLDPEKNGIIEIAAAVTDNDLNVIATSPEIAILQDEAALSLMDRWNTNQHTNSGLLSRVRTSSTTTSEAEQQMLTFVRKYCYKACSPLCGNSIGHDRRFLAKYMPKLHTFFHYQSVDVSSIKQLAARWYPAKYKAPAKQQAHRALADITESLKELQYYKKRFFVRKPR